MSDTVHLSRTAYERLKAEHDDLVTRGRIDIARKIEAARELGDLSENGDYHAAKEEQGKMQGRILHLAQPARERRDRRRRRATPDEVVGRHDRVDPLRGRRRRRALPARLDRGAGRGPRGHVAEVTARRGADRPQAWATSWSTRRRLGRRSRSSSWPSATDRLTSDAAPGAAMPERRRRADTRRGMAPDRHGPDVAGAPPLPPGRIVELPGRGTTFVREADGPAGAPTVVLLHGWSVDADLNWFACYGPLGRALPGRRARPSRPRPGHPPAGERVTAVRLRRRRRRRCSTCWRSSGP